MLAPETPSVDPDGVARVRKANFDDAANVQGEVAKSNLSYVVSMRSSKPKCPLSDYMHLSQEDREREMFKCLRLVVQDTMECPNYAQVKDLAASVEGRIKAIKATKVRSNVERLNRLQPAHEDLFSNETTKELPLACGYPLGVQREDGLKPYAVNLWSEDDNTIYLQSIEYPVDPLTQKVSEGERTRKDCELFKRNAKHPYIWESKFSCIKSKHPRGNFVLIEMQEGVYIQQFYHTVTEGKKTQTYLGSLGLIFSSGVANERSQIVRGEAYERQKKKDAELLRDPLEREAEHPEGSADEEDADRAD